MINFYKNREALYKDFIPAMCGVEVGVQAGLNAQALLDAGALELGLIDPWKHFDEGDYTADPANISQRDQDFIFGQVLEKFRAYTESSRVHIHRMTSLQAAPLFGEGSLDFCLLDGDHSYAAVYADLLAWEHTLSEKGVYLLHDFVTSPESERMKFGVFDASIRFMEERRWKPLALSCEGWNTLVLTRK